ncbi:retrovirus-related pol polyprotein from transposon TNT 1-94 [Tanacetum coccineum]|uniref:Retrovirus-related pol polyprotein from transposon TNT 1-94 n=1 Tax=Tanacetum coccineum TaxID=301880 RepID=A0ABQ5IFB7_9ASTR
MAPRAVLMKTGLKSFNTASPVNTVRSVNTGRPFSTARSFNTVRPFYTAHPKSTIHCARPRFNTGRPFRSTVNTVRARGFNAVKPSACWVWRPIKPNGASLSNSQLNDKGFVDSGCSRHMTGNIAHLSDFKDFDGGYVTFGGGAYGGRITGKGKFDGKSDEGFFWLDIPYSSKAFRVYTTLEPENVQLILPDQNLFFFTGSTEVSTVVPEVNTATPEDLVGPSHASKDTQVEDQEVELGNIPQSYAVPTTPHIRIHKDYLIEHMIGKTHQDLYTCLFSCFLSQEEPRRVSKALSDPAWVEAIQEELLQFKLQKVWILVDLLKGHRAIDTKWVYRNKKDERGIVIKNKAKLVAQGHTQEEGIDYDEVFALVWLELRAIECYLIDLEPSDKVLKDEFIFGSTKKELCDEFEKLMKDKFQMSSMGELTFFLGLQVQQKKKGIFISQDKYVNEILRKYNYIDGSMIGSLMLLTVSRGRYHVCQSVHVPSYALTKKPEIYISFIKQFWRTAEASTDTDGEVTITATIDGQSKTITEASLRRHLKLEDHDGITSIPNSEIFEQLALMGYQTNSDKLTFQKEYHVPTPNESSLYDVYSHGSDEGSLILTELTNLVTKLSERIGVLEDDLKKTKQTYSSAFTKLILRIKKLETTVKTGKARKRARVVLSEDEEDDSSKQGRKIFDIDKDFNTYFSQDDEVVHDQDTAKEGQPEDSTAGITVNTAPINISTARETRSTAGRVVYGRRSKEARKDKGKAIMTEPEPEKKSKKLLEQERLGLEEAIRLQEQVDEEERAQVERDEEI